jgi:hypothetical protein
MSRREIGLLGVTEEVAGDVEAWLLLLLGVVFRARHTGRRRGVSWVVYETGEDGVGRAVRA